jgi:hypothetical protein
MLEIMIDIAIDITGILSCILLTLIACLSGAVAIIAVGKALISLIKDKNAWEDYF